MMDGERTSCTERILSAIEYGRLPNDETERRLCELVEAEVNKTDSEADMELIKACQSLMWQLHTHGELPYDSHYDENKVKIDQRLRSNASIANTVKSIGKTLAAAAAVILLFVGVRFSWFDHSDTADGQQHVIAGQEITVEMVQNAIAENAGGGSVETTDLNELRGIVGFAPRIPETIADEWHAIMCRVWFSRKNVQVTVEYKNIQVPDETIKYVVNYYADVNDCHLTFEQNEKGEECFIGEQRVYFSTNVERNIACWCRDNVVCEISCRMNETVFKLLVEQIVRGGV